MFTGEAQPACSNRSQSPSTSSGNRGQQALMAEDSYADLCDAARTGKALNKGALAQKRFRERQKVRQGGGAIALWPGVAQGLLPLAVAVAVPVPVAQHSHRRLPQCPLPTRPNCIAGWWH